MKLIVKVNDEHYLRANGFLSINAAYQSHINEIEGVLEFWLSTTKYLSMNTFRYWLSELARLGCFWGYKTIADEGAAIRRMSKIDKNRCDEDTI